jgi:isocitrate/isopropylmalate dehydrogenase
VSPIVRLRRELDLFAVVYPLPDEVLLVREATECLFVSKERMEGDVAIAERHVSKRASERVARLAFLLALKRHQNDDDVQKKFLRRLYPRLEASVTVAHKVNIMPLTEGVFLGAARLVAEQFKGRVALRDAPADSLAADLCNMYARQKLDVVLTTNMCVFALSFCSFRIVFTGLAIFSVTWVLELAGV